MVYSLTYRRPPHVAASNASLSDDEKRRSIDGSIESDSSGISNGVPLALSFDRIIAQGTCPPVTVRDFMNYLKYVEFSAENLQFFLWFRDYSARWEELPDGEKTLSPPWAQNFDGESPHFPMGFPTVVTAPSTIAKPDTYNARNAAFELMDASLYSNVLLDKDGAYSGYAASMSDSKTLHGSTTNRHAVDQAFESAGMKWRPFTSQPYRDEVARIISVYIAQDSPRELNLSAREKLGLLHALQHTTHPSAFRNIAASIEYTLRKQSHPNFIRWSICNGNRPRVNFARGLGIAGMIAALLADIVVTLSHASRAWRVLPFIGWLIGSATLIAAYKGMCVVLHGLHHRHLRPWELFSDEPDEKSNHGFMSQETLVSNLSNSYEDEPWVPKYKKRNIIRKIFDREIWIQEPALRKIQDTILIQALIGAFILSCVMVGLFCVFPRGNLF